MKTSLKVKFKKKAELVIMTIDNIPEDAQDKEEM